MAGLGHSVVKQTEEMVNYQEGAVISRTVIGKKTGTVTIFAFDAGQKLSEHTAPFDALVQILDGSAAITIDKTEFTLEKGQMIILPANVPHAVNALSPFKMMLVMIKS